MLKNILIAAAIFAASLTAAAAPQVGPIDVTGELKGAPYRIAVPATWNGTLLIYAHGYRDRADHPGEVDNRTPDIAPSAALANLLLSQGYALAGSAYRENGWGR
jgi:opacity protein-like surface antigen